MNEFKSEMQIVDDPKFDFQRETNFAYYPYVRLNPKELPGIIATYTKRVPIHLRDNVTGIILPQHINLYSSQTLTEDEYENKKHMLSLEGYNPSLSTEMIQKFVNYSSLKFQCVACAENLNQSLREVLGNYYRFIGENNRGEILRTDFSGLRDMLSPVIKKDKRLHSIPYFDDYDKRKLYTSTFFNFIADRNILTHGILYLNTDDNQMYLNYIVKEKKIDEWAVLTNEFLQSFFWVSEQLRNPPSAISDHINQLRKVQKQS
ncbi:hypothetical protein ACFOWA_08045 [Pedobacter lithocola]|uniref:TIGR04255 family protein n=1 Tax=Pedobacter lithocola TaxID=1908239 RepID=A0ABV8PAW4_9SPHI